MRSARTSLVKWAYWRIALLKTAPLCALLHIVPHPPSDIAALLRDNLNLRELRVRGDGDLCDGAAENSLADLLSLLQTILQLAFQYASRSELAFSVLPQGLG